MDKQPRRDSNTSGMRSHLPQEIIDEILLRLPVKSLLRFRCVSKSWRALISSTRFVKAHLHKSSNDPFFRHHSVITSGHRLQQFPLAPLLFEPLAEAVDFDFLTDEGLGNSNPMISCNGLVCIKIYGRGFVLWNPSTRMHKVLPPLGNHNGWLDVWGFGYVESSDDYKVFALTCVYDPNCVFQRIAKVYSLKTGSWRTVDCDWNHTELPFCGTATYLGGKLYWLRRSASGWEIMTFDLANGEFGTGLELPDTLKYWHARSLGVLDGHFCVLYAYDADLFKREHDVELFESDMDWESAKDLEIWVLKQSVAPSWSKMMALPEPSGAALSYLDSFMLRMGNGAILCCDEQDLAIYYPRGRMFEKLTVRKLGAFRYANVHVESLVSL